ncbi:MAG: hypothetical protein AABW75_02220 [Nanoarchaeota archaeon]
MAIDSLTLDQYEHGVQKFIKEISQHVLLDDVLLRSRVIEFREGLGTGYLHGMIIVGKTAYYININEKELLLSRNLGGDTISFAGEKVRDFYHGLESREMIINPSE